MRLSCEPFLDVQELRTSTHVVDVRADTRLFVIAQNPLMSAFFQFGTCVATFHSFHNNIREVKWHSLSSESVRNALPALDPAAAADRGAATTTAAAVELRSAAANPAAATVDTSRPAANPTAAAGAGPAITVWRSGARLRRSCDAASQSARHTVPGTILRTTALPSTTGPCDVGQ